MKTIQQNISAASEARTTLKAHCLALAVTETQQYLTVIFPEGFKLDGVRVSMANGKSWAYEKALEKMEQIWINV